METHLPYDVSGMFREGKEAYFMPVGKKHLFWGFFLCFLLACLCGCGKQDGQEELSRFTDSMEQLAALPAYHCVTQTSIIESGEEVISSVQESWAHGDDYLYLISKPTLPELRMGYLCLDGVLYTYNVGNADPLDTWAAQDGLSAPSPWAGIFTDSAQSTELLSAEQADGQQILRVLRGEETSENGVTTSPVTLTAVLDADGTVVSLHCVYTLTQQSEGAEEDVVITMESSTEFLSCDADEIDALLRSQLE